MTRKTRNLFIATAFLVLLAAVAVLTGKAGVNRNTEKDAASSTAEEASGKGDSEFVMLIDIPPIQVRALKMENPDGGMNITSMDGINWIVDDVSEGYRANESLLRSMVKNLSEMDARLINRNPTDPGAFGMKEPSARIVLLSSEGERFTLRFGNENPAGNGRYVSREGDDAVYLAPATKANKAYWTASTVRDDSLAAISLETIVEVEIVSEGKRFHIVPHAGELDAFRPMFSPLDVKAPWKSRQLLEDRFWQEFLAETSLPTRISGYPDPPPTNRNSVGLGSEADSLFVRDSSGTELRILIGNDAGKGERYAARMSDPDDIFLLDASNLGFLDADPFKLTSRFAFLAGIDRVRGLEIKGVSSSHTLEIEKLGNPDDESDDEFRIDGVLVTKKRFKDAYKLVISLLFEGVAESLPESMSPEVTIDFTHVDPAVGTKTLEFIPYNDTYYICGLSGEPKEFLISRFQLEFMMEKVKKIATGENLP